MLAPFSFILAYCLFYYSKFSSVGVHEHPLVFYCVLTKMLKYFCQEIVCVALDKCKPNHFAALGKMVLPDFVDLNKIAAGCFDGTDKT